MSAENQTITEIQNWILSALDELHPGGFDGFDLSLPTPQNYAEYVAALLPEENPHTEAALIAAFEMSQATINPVPESVLSHQLFTALSRHGIPESTITAIIAGMPEGQAKVEADLAFRRAPQIRRDHPIALGIAMALSLSTETVDEIFREAAEI